MRKALIVVDMLNDFVRPEGSLFVPGAPDALPAMARELARARRDGDLVIFVCDAHADDDLEFHRFPPHAIAGTEGARVVDELAPTPGEVIIFKKRMGPFYGTELDQVLRREGVNKATVVGVCTHICVMETVAGLCERDLPAVVPADAVADFDDELAAAAIKRMESVFGARITEA